jgi:protein-tyrosine phosphatase
MLRSRNIVFNSIVNFRDIGGYRTQGGNIIAWRRIFRSGELNHMTENDFNILSNELKVTSVIDLRSKFETQRDGLGLLSGSPNTIIYP